VAATATLSSHQESNAGPFLSMPVDTSASPARFQLPG
jgi:hypothetical protein